MDQETDKNPTLVPEGSLPSNDGVKSPSLQPKREPYSILDTRPVRTIDTLMPRPSVLNCPQGLEYLTDIDKLLFIKDRDIKARKIEYFIKNNSGENVYTAVEDYDLCCTICCNITRPFEVKVLDYQEREVLHLNRPLRSQDCCFPCCLQSVKVTASGTLCGFIKQSWHPLKPKFRICNASGKTVLLIQGPSFIFKPIQFLGPDFKVLLTDGKTEVGNVSQYLPYIEPGNFSNSAHFSVSFPKDLDVNTKAVLLAASILIDTLYYATTTRSARRVSESFGTGFEIGSCFAECLT